ncbi:hypothetical protein BVY04_02475 [bacterium M21]|nr:hypothetical protein BVY04_02475 [bacterium M21]
MSKDVTRLFPFVLRARKLIVGRERLERSKRDLQLVIITEDISVNSKAEILKTFEHYPIVQHFTTDDIDAHFNVKNTKVIGISKSSLATSIYAELKQYRINKPEVTGTKKAE